LSIAELLQKCGMVKSINYSNVSGLLSSSKGAEFIGNEHTNRYLY